MLRKYCRYRDNATIPENSFIICLKKSLSSLHEQAVECSAAGIESPNATPWVFSSETAGILSEPEKFIKCAAPPIAELSIDETP